MHDSAPAYRAILKVHSKLRPGFGTEAAVYGTLLVSGLIAVSSVHSETKSVAVLITVIATVLVFWGAHVYAGTIARMSDPRSDPESGYVNLKQTHTGNLSRAHRSATTRPVRRSVGPYPSKSGGGSSLTSAPSLCALRPREARFALMWKLAETGPSPVLQSVQNSRASQAERARIQQARTPPAPHRYDRIEPQPVALFAHSNMGLIFGWR